MTRTPRTVDWQSVLDTPLTAALAQRGNPNMPEAVVSKRILSALHEGSHLLAAARYRVPVIGVNIVGTNGRAHQLFGGGSSDGSCMTQGDGDEADAAVSFAGCAFEEMIFGETRLPAGTNDQAEGLRILLNCALRSYDSALKREVQRDGAIATLNVYRKLSDEVEVLLLDHWDALDAAATALLMYSDAKGRVNAGKSYVIKQGLINSMALGLGRSRNRSRSPDGLRRCLGRKITAHWRGFSVQDDPEKWIKIEADILARHNIVGLAAKADAMKVEIEAMRAASLKSPLLSVEP